MYKTMNKGKKIWLKNPLHYTMNILYINIDLKEAHNTRGNWSTKTILSANQSFQYLAESFQRTKCVGW